MSELTDCKQELESMKTLMISKLRKQKKKYHLIILGLLVAIVGAYFTL